ncbi:MAG TPA: sigma-70 family RNA polymerase sigma factor, partial [Pilimelia sp.]|nr:sigma-70 family RNA polymerase sigma factor [Pilimelia sp.]
RAVARVEPAAEPLDERAAARLDAARGAAEVARAVAALPRRQRDVLLLYAVAELEYAQIAEALGVPLGTVQSALHRARTKVRAALTSTPGGPR